MRLSSASIRNYHFTLTMAVLLALFGVGGFSSMPRSENPLIDLPEGVVTVVYPGASPEDVESLIVDPLEDLLSEIDEIELIEAKINVGLAMVRVEWDKNEDPNDIESQVRGVLASARDQFPRGVENAEFRVRTSTSVRVMQIALVSSVASPRTLRKLADRLKDDLLRVTGVKRVEFDGDQREVVNIEVDPNRIAQYDMSLARVVEAIRSYSSEVPGGSLDVGRRSLNIRTSGGYSSLEQINRTVVAAGDGRPVYLEDMATVRLGYADALYKTRSNGTPCIFVSYRQATDANVLSVNARVRELLDDFRETLPDDIELRVAFDQATSVDERISLFLRSLAQGMVLVGFVLLISMRWDAAAISVVAIPLSFLIGIGVVDALGYGLQQMTIVGLVIALGLLVDNAIVVTENIGRHLSTERDRTVAIEKAMSQITGAIASSTATTAAAFAPLLFMDNVTGDFIRSMPATVIATLLASLLVALTVTPLVCHRLLGTGMEAAWASKRIRSTAQTLYLPAVRRALQRPGATLTASFVLFAVLASLAPLVGVRFFPKAEKPLLVVTAHTPEGSSFESTDSVARQLEAIIQEQPEVEHISANVGGGNPAIYYNLRRLPKKKSTAQLVVSLARGPDLRDAGALSEDLRVLASKIPGVRVEVNELEQGPPIEAPIVVRIRGEDLSTLAALSSEVQALLEGISGSVNVFNPLASRNIDLNVQVNNDKASLLRVPISRIGETVRSAVSGTPEGQYRDSDGDVYDIVVKLARTTGPRNPKQNGLRAPQFDELVNVYVPNVTGGPVALRELATFDLEDSYQFIMHRNLRRMAFLTGDTHGRGADEVVRELQAGLDQLDLPPGYSVEVGGELESRGESFSGVFRALLVALVSIFGVLVLQFRSFAQPLIVFSSIPLGVVGAIGGLLITGNPFSFTALLGITSLVGIVVNNSILLVDCANQNRSAQRPMDEAILIAAELRIRPVVITMATTLTGLLPLTLFGGSFWAPMGWAMIFGLLVSTSATLIVTPVLYKLFSARE